MPLAATLVVPVIGSNPNNPPNKRIHHFSVARLSAAAERSSQSMLQLHAIHINAQKHVVHSQHATVQTESLA